MSSPEDLKNKFWKTLKSDRTVMLGVTEIDDGQGRPMTALVEENADGELDGPIWFFSSTDNHLVQAGGGTAVVSFAAKNHSLFAAIRGDIVVDTNRAVVERLWNPFVAAWYPGGKDDPKLAMLRLEPETAEIWENEYSLLAGIKALFGRDPRDDYSAKQAEVKLD
ncbi:pyridoxamine 5'-phosphate oxidase family protein [Xinfangfangia sp. CPCC 101601]|uniref:Pyridoxamine 5'-phosphate oxidase family protein n=1 Tax=Pseudogemmobacter lacusdianii TaxID=3069608 RepID=A0ABU0W0Y2_9RHOB|nr:pyridoxamine 5'-phosphate oxidase family protein [Xinfangfangia sp. CPCC 101601]MDQ2067674.1 pyridoxamine 5'-phosphate oxidase family protein [Xinfangfangia sp. CPCC 101601]